MRDQLRTVANLLEDNELKKAEIILARYLRSDLVEENRAEALIYRAKIRLRSARPDDAIDDLLTSQKILPKTFEQPDMLELFGDCYLARFEMSSVGFADRNDTEKANGYFQAILERYPTYMNRGWVFYQLGRLSLSSNNVEQAEAYFQKALLAPSSVAVLTAYSYERLGFLSFYEKRDFDTALGFLNKVIDTYPAAAPRSWLAQVHILRSRVFRETREYQQAVDAAKLAVTVAEDEPENPAITGEALLTLAELLLNFENRQKEAAVHLQQFLQISKKPLGVDVTWSRVHEMLGDIYFNLGQYVEAGEAYEAALQYNPYHPWQISLHYRIAQSYYQDSNYSGAIEAIKHLMAVAQADGETVDDYRVYDILGNAQFALGQYSAATQAYETALKMAPPNADGLGKIKQYYKFAQDLS